LHSVVKCNLHNRYKIKATYNLSANTKKKKKINANLPLSHARAHTRTKLRDATTNLYKHHSFKINTIINISNLYKHENTPTKCQSLTQENQVLLQAMPVNYREKIAPPFPPKPSLPHSPILCTMGGGGGESHKKTFLNETKSTYVHVAESQKKT
jgi:hypothetical protein